MSSVDFLCDTCDKAFTNHIDLQRHVQRIHLAPSLSCFHCSYTTKWKHLLEKHMLIKHESNGVDSSHGRTGRDRRRLSFLKCSLCDSFQCKDRSVMIDHYVEVHDVEIVQKHLDFADMNAFEDWKKETEASQCFRFVRFGSYKTRDSHSARYRCFRDGYYMSSSEGKRRLKKQGSCKMNGVCPCSLKVVTSMRTGAVKVSYISSHVGHTMDIGRMNLTKEERQDIYDKLSRDIPSSVIVDTIRESMVDGNYSRIHLTTRKDLANIKESFQIFQAIEGRSYSDDHASLEAWIRTVENPSDVVRFYKAQSVSVPEYPELLDEDFILILSYDAQIELLEKFGSQIICLDGTHVTNSYNFDLHTILVKDDKNQGFPCAFLISNRSDSQIIELFLTVVNNLLPQPVVPKVFMSDVSDVYYKGWCSAMGQPENWLFCQWHVDQAWRRKLKEIDDPKKQCSVYKLLRRLMNAPDENSFLQLYPRALATLREDPALVKFEEYFRSEYCNKTRSWALCYRKGLKINSSMILESMRKIVKRLYFDGSKIKRLDKGINCLLQFVRDKFFDKCIVEPKEKSISSQISSNPKKNQNIRSLDGNSTVIAQETGWLISTPSSLAFSSQSNPEARSDDQEPLSDRELLLTDSEDEEERIVENVSAQKRAAIATSAHNNLEKAKEALTRDMLSIIQSVETMDDIDVIRRALTSVPDTLRAIKSGLTFTHYGHHNTFNY